MGIFNFNRLEFIAAFKEMRQKAFTKSTILSSWKAAGLFPFDPDKIITPLREKQAQGQKRPSTASSTSSTSTTSTWPTPKKLSDLHQYAGYLKEVEFKNEQVDRRYQRFIKGALAKAISGTEAEETLEMHKKKAAESAKLKQGTRRVIAKGGVLRAGYAVAHIEQRRAEEVESARIHARAQELPRNKRGVFKRQLATIAKFDSLERPTKRTKRADSI
ncbi:hypothetical protein GJ744_002086 [Endocarpon pusillum]|uniref:Uncharacterized protein n=1 Tax=Endocarpon pusillum TaxID=364733 RepID=A0A8H7ACG5_9EURO|nr:hypothetical protein GJ744_002086 [Endocarpon pusillum]